MTRPNEFDSVLYFVITLNWADDTKQVEDDKSEAGDQFVELSKSTVGAWRFLWIGQKNIDNVAPDEGCIHLKLVVRNMLIRRVWRPLLPSGLLATDGQSADNRQKAAAGAPSGRNASRPTSRPPAELHTNVHRPVTSHSLDLNGWGSSSSWLQ